MDPTGKGKIRFLRKRLRMILLGTRVNRVASDAPRELCAHMFANAGGIGLEHCTLTDDGMRCASEYNWLRWGTTQISPQAGVAVYERGSSELLSAARIYDAWNPRPSRTRLWSKAETSENVVQAKVAEGPSAH
jgi:hypothetical protein